MSFNFFLHAGGEPKCFCCKPELTFSGSEFSRLNLKKPQDNSNHSIPKEYIKLASSFYFISLRNFFILYFLHLFIYLLIYSQKETSNSQVQEKDKKFASPIYFKSLSGLFAKLEIGGSELPLHDKKYLHGKANLFSFFRHSHIWVTKIIQISVSVIIWKIPNIDELS